MHLFLLGLQVFQVLFVLLHDIVPVGSLNDVRAVRGTHTRGELLGKTILTSAAFAVPLAGSFVHLHDAYPPWLIVWLWAAYVTFAFIEWREWWRPYFFGPTYDQIALYKNRYSRTHAFLPRQNGVKPNTMHVVLHAATLLTLLVLFAGTFGDHPL